VAYFCAAQWPDFAPPLTGKHDTEDTGTFTNYVRFLASQEFALTTEMGAQSGYARLHL